MFENLELYYQQESKSIKNPISIVVIVILSSIISQIIFQILNFNSSIINHILLTLFTLLIVIIIYSLTKFKKYNIKPSLNYKEIINILREEKEKNSIEDIEMIEKYLKDNNLYNDKIIENLINHYRSIIASNPKSDIFFPILTLVLTIIIASEDKINISIIIPVLVLSCVITFAVKQHKDMYLILTKKENMYLNLENILCIIYINFLNNNKTKE